MKNRERVNMEVNVYGGIDWEKKYSNWNVLGIEIKGLTISNIQNKCRQKKLKGSKSPAVL